MKTIIAAFVFAVALGLASADPGSSEENSKEWKKVGALKKYLNESGYIDKVTDPLDEWCTGASEKIEAALEKVIECDESVPDSVTTCESVKTHGMRCAQPLIKVISDCLPQGSRDLPETAMKVLISGFEYICKQDGEHILELANSCAYEFDEEDAKIKACAEKVSDDIDAFKITRSDIPTKAQLCDFGKHIKNCMSYQVNKACGNDKTKRAHLGLMDALLVPCNAA